MGVASAMLSILFTAFSFHVIMFGLEVILSIIIVIQLFYAHFSGNQFYREESKKFMNYIAVTYASAHFFLTATTVMALTFFPDFLVLAGQVLFYPLGFIIFMLVLRLLMISYFWYGWDSIPEKVHLLVGAVFALSGVLWVYLYTVLLGFMNYAKGLTQVEPLIVNDILLFTNPTTITLLPTIVFGAITTTCGFLVFHYGKIILNRTEIKEPDAEYQYNLFQYYNYAGFISSIFFGFSLLLYLRSLSIYSPHKYRNWLGALFNQNAPSLDLGWLFFVLILLVLILLLLWGRIVYHVAQSEHHAVLVTAINRWQYFLIGPLLAIIFEVFILINFLSQDPYFVISPYSDTVVGMQVDTSMNPYADIIDIYALTIFGFFPLIMAFFTLLYFIFTGRIGGDFEYEGPVASRLS